MITPAQCRAARAWLNITQQTLAAAAGVGHSTIKDFEREARVPIANNIVAIENALARYGFSFTHEAQAAGLSFVQGRKDR